MIVRAIEIGMGDAFGAPRRGWDRSLILLPIVECRDGMAATYDGGLWQGVQSATLYKGLMLLSPLLAWWLTRVGRICRSVGLSFWYQEPP